MICRLASREVLFRLLALCAPFLFLEATIRLFDFARGASPYARASWFWAFQQDRFLGYRLRPHLQMKMAGETQYDTNAEGFRDIEVPVIPTSPRHLIICQGESSTWGTGASNRYHTWPRLLEQIFYHQGAEAWTTLNAGIPGYTLIENVQLLQLRLLKYHPDALLYMGFRNDWVTYATKLEPYVDINQYPRTLASLPDTFMYRLLMHSSVFAFGVSRIGVLYPLDTQGTRQPPASTIVTPLGERVFRDQIALLHLLCQRNGVRLIWVDQPINFARLPQDSVQSLQTLRAILHDELRIHGIPLVSAHGLYDQTRAPMIDDVHFSDAGNAQLAHIIAPQVMKILGAAP